MAPSCVRPRSAPAAVLLAVLAAGPALAAPPPGESATAFIRVYGRSTTEVTRAWTERYDGGEELIGTGSGFLVGPGGLLVTNHHVVAGVDMSRERFGERIEVSFTVTRIEVMLPGDGGEALRVEAHVLADDPELDLALLSLPLDRPWLPLGDTDAVPSGEPLRVLGFPRGNAVEVARSGASDAMPGVSDSRGRATALRQDDQGQVRYLQLDAAVNPGNSGGPVLDADGYVVGVVRMRLRESDGLGFAVATSPLKDFLERAGGATTRRLRLGPRESPPGKRLSLRLPEGWSDEAGERVRVAAESEPDLRLRLERVATPWTAEQLASAVASGSLDDDFGGGTADRAERVEALLLGRSRAGGLEMEYAVLTVGEEAIVARWIGDAELVAYNRGVLRGSLASLEAEPLSAAGARLDSALEPLRLRRGPEPPPSLPAGWLDEALRASPCPGLPEPGDGAAARWPGDFRVVFRAAWWPDAPLASTAAAGACSARLSGLGEGSWALTSERLGVVFAREGLALERDGGLLLLEVETPAEAAARLMPVAAAWIGAHLHR